MTGTDLARYACDYCRRKKFRCTRELPQCGVCKPWPGPCNYSRDIPDTGTSLTTTAALPNTQKPDDIQLRLQNIEKEIQGLTDVVEKAVVAINKISSTSPKDNTILQTTSADDQASRLYVGKQNSFSVLDDATNSVHGAAGSLPSSLQQSAASELQFLSASLTTAVADNRPRGDSFYVPPRSQGYQLIGKFLEIVCLGDAFFIAPSEELLLQVIFHPEQIVRRSWIVYIDYMILAMLSADQSAETKGFRNNVKLALNDSKIFLEPHLVHLQTLILLAIHGEDYASPSLSWMLVGHACRQAEALGLHTSDNSDFENHQRGLSLFWMLFAVDKSCCLAFGRPCFLAYNTYATVELPSLDYLTRFQPRPESAGGQGQSSVFGAHMFLSRMKLARLTGDIMDLANNSGMVSKRDQLKTDLTNWQTQTKHLLNGILDSERASSSLNQRREMSLGISTMSFEYLHVFMVLTRADPSCVGPNLDAAREAISLLPSLVSNWTSIYNPMTWHLLYFPFLPFFIIFENLVHNHASTSKATKQHDMELLSSTVSYYSSMRNQFQLLAPLCERLKNVAEVFHRLVVVLVGRHGTMEQNKGSVEPISVGDISNISTLDTNAIMTFEEIEVELGDEIGVDLRQYLEWLPADVLPFEIGSFGDISTGNVTSETKNSFPIDEQVGARGTKRPFDVMFDWFAWDSYE